MDKITLRSLLVIVISCAIAGLIVLAASPQGVYLNDIPLIAVCAGIAFAIQWVVFIHAYLKQTEVFYDLTGSITYITVVITALYFTGADDNRSLLLAGLISIWALRLGSFLFIRILQDGGDGRFDDIKPRFARFLATWTLQGLWVFLTLCAALAAITSRYVEPIGSIAAIGAAIWVLGFAIESFADRQKRDFRKDKNNNGKFINTGLWTWSRHPNYFGEIIIWIGIAIIAAPALHGWQWATMISPIFVTLLLTKVSGVPLLEARADKKWGGQADYEAYKRDTPVLIPRPPKK